MNYRAINAKTRKDLYPPPRTDDIFRKNNYCGRKGLSSHDLGLKNGFYQVQINEKNREKTDFMTTEGLFQFKGMPFGLCKSPFKRSTSYGSIATAFQWVPTLSLLNDVAIFADSFEDQIIKLRAVLEALLSDGLNLNPLKCSLAIDTIRYLGQVIDCDGIRPDPQKLKVIDRFPDPRDTTSLKSFLGLADSCRALPHSTPW